MRRNAALKECILITLSTHLMYILASLVSISMPFSLHHKVRLFLAQV